MWPFPGPNSIPTHQNPLSPITVYTVGTPNRTYTVQKIQLLSVGHVSLSSVCLAEHSLEVLVLPIIKSRYINKQIGTFVITAVFKYIELESDPDMRTISHSILVPTVFWGQMIRSRTTNDHHHCSCLRLLSHIGFFIVIIRSVGTRTAYRYPWVPENIKIAKLNLFI